MGRAGTFSETAAHEATHDGLPKLRTRAAETRESPVQPISHLAAAIRYWPLLVVACCTKWGRIVLLHAVARSPSRATAVQAENAGESAREDPLARCCESTAPPKGLRRRTLALDAKHIGNEGRRHRLWDSPRPFAKEWQPPCRRWYSSMRWRHRFGSPNGEVSGSCPRHGRDQQVLSVSDSDGRPHCHASVGVRACPARAGGNWYCWAGVRRTV
jgi:hypothetical protein